MRNEEVLKEINATCTIEFWTISHWYGHVHRIKDTRWPKTKKRRAPAWSWKKYMKKAMKERERSRNNNSELPKKMKQKDRENCIQM